MTHGARLGTPGDATSQPSFEIVETRDGVRFSVHVQPRARRNEVAGLHGVAAHVRVTAPPAEGAANQALIALLAKRLSVPKSAIRLVAGASSRDKVIEVQGITAQVLRAILFEGR